MCVYVCVCVCVYTHHIFFIHSSANGHLCYFHVLATVNSTAMNTGVHASLWTMVFFGYVPRSGIVGLCSNSIFSLLRKLHTVLHSSGTGLHSHHRCRRVPFSPHPLQQLLLLIFFFNECCSDWCEVIPHCSSLTWL